MLAESPQIITGRRAVLEILRAGRRRVQRLYVAEGAQARGALAEILGEAETRGVPVARVGRDNLPGEDAQGLAAEVEPYPYSDLGEILDRAAAGGEPILALLLDAIQDPQNLGTLLRTAEAVGVHGVILPYRQGVGVSPAVVRVSSGASEHLLVARENLAQAMARLKEAGAWLVGLDMDPGAEPLDQADLRGPLGLVVGGEGSGLRRLVRESCDRLVRLPMRGRLGSLNAAVAGSVVLYAAWAQRGYARRSIDAPVES
ncbi:MAG TPA: 23S rRNA (guanosine(2251)-2'-O)-methyltransferase RlmB [Anaerolineales bacterium]|nr:23S rRNA (guanosine(2251)-2'-O)-methyltransferase RlmB [Anaerolineales bacterium]